MIKEIKCKIERAITASDPDFCRARVAARFSFATDVLNAVMVEFLTIEPFRRLSNKLNVLASR